MTFSSRSHQEEYLLVAYFYLRAGFEVEVIFMTSCRGVAIYYVPCLRPSPPETKLELNSF